MRKTIGIDVDNTIVDINQEVINFFLNNGFRFHTKYKHLSSSVGNEWFELKRSSKSGSIISYDYSNLLVNTQHKERSRPDEYAAYHLRHVLAAFDNDKLYDNSVVPANLVEFIERLDNVYNINVVFISGISGNHYNSKEKMLERHFPNIPFIGTHAKEFVNVDVMIDDRQEVLNKIAYRNPSCYLIRPESMFTQVEQPIKETKVTHGINELCVGLQEIGIL